MISITIWVHKNQQALASKLLATMPVPSKEDYVSINTGSSLRMLIKHVEKSDLIYFIEKSTNNNYMLAGFSPEGLRTYYPMRVPDFSTQKDMLMFIKSVLNQTQFDNLAKHKLLEIVDPTSL